MGRSAASHGQARTQAQAGDSERLLVGGAWSCSFLNLGLMLGALIYTDAWALPLRVRTGDGVTTRTQLVELEDYLVNVVAQEMNAKEFPDAALQAQAITARSYAVAKQREAARTGRPFDLESSVLDQVYVPNAAVDPRARAAVTKTRGQVLADAQSGAVFAPYYHSTCGGMTELPASVWGRQAGTAERYIKTPCAFCAESPRAHWESALTQEVIAQKLALAPGERVVQWSLSVPQAEQRVSKIVALTNRGRKVTHSGQKWRAVLGFEVLRSLRLEQPKLRGDVWIFSGRGAGHGVGMCQWGARGAARAGWTAERILRHYYPFARVARVARVAPLGSSPVQRD